MEFRFSSRTLGAIHVCIYVYRCGFSLYSCSTLSITTHLAPRSSFQMISIFDSVWFSWVLTCSTLFCSVAQYSSLCCGCCLLFVAVVDVVDVVEPLDFRNAQIKQKKQIWSSTAIIKLLFLLFITLLNKWSFGSDVN